MKVDSLANILPTVAPAQIGEWLSQFKKEKPAGSQNDFLSYLLLNKLISKLDFYAACDGMDVSLRDGSLDEDSSLTLVGSKEDSEVTNASGLDEYELIDEIGRGAMGEVHVAKDLKLKRKVALK